MPSGVTNSPTSAGSDGVSHPLNSHPTETGLLMIDSKQRNAIILSVLAVLMFIEGALWSPRKYVRFEGGRGVAERGAEGSSAKFELIFLRDQPL